MYRSVRLILGFICLLIGCLTREEQSWLKNYRNRKLPRQGHNSEADSHAACGLGMKVQGGTPPRLSCGRSVL
jgi:hypothetical protein